MEALRENDLAEKTDLTVFCDGPRTSSDVNAVRAVRDVVTAIRGFKSISIIQSQTNRGLAESIIGGVSKILEESPTVIVLEDDLVTSRHFLSFMNDGLRVYMEDSRVASIHAYSPPTRRPLPHTYFLQGSDCWGWATWRRAWAEFNPDASALLLEIRRRKLERKFDYFGTRRLVKMLADNAAGRNGSWAIRWHASAFLKEMYTLNPGTSLVQNIGFDGSGSHCDARQDFVHSLDEVKVSVERQPIEESDEATMALREFYSELMRTQVKRRLWSWLRRWFPAPDTQS